MNNKLKLILLVSILGASNFSLSAADISVQNERGNSKFIETLKKHKKIIAISAATITSIVAATILVTFKKEQIKKYFSSKPQPKPVSALELEAEKKRQEDEAARLQKEIEQKALEQERLALESQEKIKRELAANKRLKINEIQSNLAKYKEEYPELVKNVQPIVEPIKNALEVLSKYPANDEKVKELNDKLKEATKDIDLSLENIRKLNEEMSKETEELGQLEQQLESIASKK